jgi:SAM-dependent methyltransferase
MTGNIVGEPRRATEAALSDLRVRAASDLRFRKRRIGNQKQVEHHGLMLSSGIQEPRQMEYLIRKADRITRFPAKMSPRLAYWYLRGTFAHESDRERTFYDPMCGSGTSALVAAALGYSVLASDISYPAVIIARAKLTKLTKNEVKVIKEFPATIKISVSRPSTAWSNWQIWYRPHVLRTLEVLRDAIFDEKGDCLGRFRS